MLVVISVYMSEVDKAEAKIIELETEAIMNGLTLRDICKYGDQVLGELSTTNEILELLLADIGDLNE